MTMEQTKMKKLLISFCLANSLTLAMTTTHAEQRPMHTKDSRMQVFNYTTEDVFLVKTKMGHSSLIQFENGEIIHDDGGLGIGEARDWSIAVKGNNVFFKPLQAYIPPTNMIVVTNKRTYAFGLETTNSNDMTYVARFNYPDDKVESSAKSVKPMPKEFKRVKQGDTSYLIDAKINTAYVKRGSAELMPTAMWDDGLFTYLQYNNAKELPSVYKVMPDGSESLVNTHINNDTVVIHEVNRLYRLRLGQSVAELRNRNLKDSGFNQTGTSTPDTVRTEQ